jgi:hypothetical protein
MASNSRSAARESEERAERVRRAGLVLAEMDWEVLDGGESEVDVVVVSLNVLECERVGLGTTGPMERREAAK